MSYLLNYIYLKSHRQDLKDNIFAISDVDLHHKTTRSILQSIASIF